jgi:hypothetical protein
MAKLNSSRIYGSLTVDNLATISGRLTAIGPTNTVVTPTLGSAANTSAIFTGSENLYGLGLMVSGTGSTILQSQRFDGISTTYNILLNPSGGNVGIGTTSPSGRLHVDTPVGGGDIILTSGTTTAKVGASQDTPGVYIGSLSNNNLFLQTNNTTRMTLDTSGNADFLGNIRLTGTPTTTNQSRTIEFTGFDKEATGDFSDNAYIRHTVNSGGLAGSVLEISAQNDADDGVNFLTNNLSGLRHNGNIVLNAGNYNSYAPTLTGGNASGTWAINITGAAGSATSSTTSNHIQFEDGPRNLSDRSPSWKLRSAAFDFVSAATVGGTGNYGGVLTFAPWQGTTASTGDSSYQLGFRNESGVNASGIPGLALRNGIDSTWNSWNKIWHEGNDGPNSGLDADTVDGQNFSYSNSSNSPTWIWGSNSNGTSFLASRTSLVVNNVSGTVAIGNGGTSSTTASGARSQLDVSRVRNGTTRVDSMSFSLSGTTLTISLS